mgnify:CR=1 FL=1
MIVNLITTVYNFLWGDLFTIPLPGGGSLGISLLILLLIPTGIYFTIRTRFLPIRLFPDMIRALSEKKNEKSSLSSFQTLIVSTATRVGMGNLVGVVAAVSAGGAGAVFWMWVTAIIGSSTAFIEATLAQLHKEEDPLYGGYRGGPAYYITKGMGEKWRPMAVFFSIAIIIALGCIGNMVQSNSISNAMHTAFGVPLVITGIVTAILAGAVFFGGVARLASVTEKIVPFMAAIYIIGGSYVIACHAGELGNAFRLIFVAAFDPQAVMGGALGLTVAKAMQFGVARGLFSNEAGMGTTPHAHAVAKVEHPAEQGLVAIFGVFTTVLIVTFTVLVILVTGVMDFDTTGIALTQKAYSVGLGSAGVGFVAICLFFFAYSTIIGWYFFSEQNVRYLFHGRGIFVYRVIVCAFLVLGAVTHVNLVWTLSDFFNGIMVIPNVIALMLLHKVVGASLKDFESKLKKAHLQ